ncbi:hypothetical protein JQ634_26065 [Bradyrhizobium sp. AUGA SZCCT0240]|uniref:hypothetical protein n=1 Tax=unclassified Bradyrhizobium TaxID=2631580 RepID=UPI001BA5DF8B|nr:MULTISPECIES: hypothetical protein [unclassified Bradyrhizobium]MBR1242364.1 hypothetical protein [Bradyrhizobium sp. AUGA SZCCT0274]MBR1257144.1 hypothetical protein [Bradyrhizobium sp. AUGA SZCCT0240]
MGALAPALGGEAPALLVSAPGSGAGFLAFGSTVMGALAPALGGVAPVLLVSFPIIIGPPVWAEAKDDPRTKSAIVGTVTSFFM